MKLNSLCSWIVIGLAVLLVSGCSRSSKMGLNPQYVTMQNTMAAVGMAQMGVIHEGYLDAGENTAFPMTLDLKRCYAFGVLTDEDAENVNISVTDTHGNLLSSDQSLGGVAIARYCVLSQTDVTVQIDMAKGKGYFIFGTWGTVSEEGTLQFAAPTLGRGTCQSPTPLIPNQLATGDTSLLDGYLHGTCNNSSGPEQIFSLSLEHRSQVTVSVESQFNSVVYITTACGNIDAQLVCDDYYKTSKTPKISAVLEAGEYFVVVDGQEPLDSGRFALNAEVIPIPPMDQICAQAPVLTPDRTQSGTTTGGVNAFSFGSEHLAGALDAVYRMDISEPSRLHLKLDAKFDSQLYLLDQCSSQVDPVGESGRDDLFIDVSPGTYYVVVDGRDSEDLGEYSLSARIFVPSKQSGSSRVQFDDVPELMSGKSVPVDTFITPDTLSGSCGGNGASDNIFRLEIQKKSRFRAQVHRENFEGVLYLKFKDGHSLEELSCNGFDNRVDIILEPGTYYLVVDGKGKSDFGTGELDVDIEDLTPAIEACEQAPKLNIGKPTEGILSTPVSYFASKSDNGRGGRDQVYQLVVRKTSQVEITATGNFDGYLYLRRECVNAMSELEFNDDYNNGSTSRIITRLSPGTYFVIVDSRRMNASMTYSITASVTPTKSR